MKKNYEVKFDWVKSEKIDKVGLVTLNHENSLNPLSAGFVEAIYLSCKKLVDPLSLILDLTITIFYLSMPIKQGMQTTLVQYFHTLV